LVIDCVVFFFQAEDGIRDYKVTGVQTCALPIYWTTERPGLGLGENIFDVGSAFLGGAGPARTGTRAAGEAADAAEGAAPGVRAAGALDNTDADTSAIAGRAGSISDKPRKLGENTPS